MQPAYQEQKQSLSLENFPKEGSSFDGKNATYQVLLMDCLVLRGAEVLKSPHFCKIFELGKVEGKFRFIIITMLGSSLHVLRMSQAKNCFSLGTALRFAQQSLEALQDMHSIGFLHRDIKPSNFGIGRQESNDFHIVYIFDFGLARQFATRDKDCRIPRRSAPFRGTPRYASLNSHKKRDQSPKDDIESWFYMVVEWTNQDRDKIMLMKEQSRESVGIDMLLKGCPLPHYHMILQYIDQLQYTSIPDYGYIYFLLKHIAKKNRIRPDQPLDYDPEHPYAGTETPPSCLPQAIGMSLKEEKQTPLPLPRGTFRGKKNKNRNSIPISTYGKSKRNQKGFSSVPVSGDKKIENQMASILSSTSLSESTDQKISNPTSTSCEESTADQNAPKSTSASCDRRKKNRKPLTPNLILRRESSENRKVFNPTSAFREESTDDQKAYSPTSLSREESNEDQKTSKSISASCEESIEDQKGSSFNSASDSCGKRKKNRKSTLVLHRESNGDQKRSSPSSIFANIIDNTGALLAKTIKDLEENYEELKRKRKNLNTGNALSEEFRNENGLLERLINYLRLKEILSLMQNSEVREAFRTGTKGAIQLTETELEYLVWLSAKISPAINSVPNRRAWCRRLRDIALKGKKFTTGSSEEITNSWTGYDTKRLLERIDSCDFFSGRRVWMNIKIFNRLNQSESIPRIMTSDSHLKSNANSFKKCYSQTSSNDSIVEFSVQQNVAQSREKASSNTPKTNAANNYAFIKRSDKPDDYYLCYNFYPARFTADVKVPPSLARRPPGIFRCE
uniref:Protein kinase domain-containing protein n=1 Tax=Setaria digitata TaxID=48799 RepID=A0A915PEZ9_9BILA